MWLNLLILSLALPQATHASVNPTAPPLGFPSEIQHSWGNLSPWFPATEYVPPPAGCKIVQANLVRSSIYPGSPTILMVWGGKLQRHGARYPTPGEGVSIQASVNKMKNATEIRDKQFSFIKTYDYTLGVDDLVPFGAAQSFDAGAEHFVRYASLVNENMLPFVRASSQQRVVDSAWNWTAGFAYASNYAYVPKLSVIVSESTPNDTLNTDCPSATSSSDKTTAWTDVFAPDIVDRFNAAAPGANLTNSNIVSLMSLCPYETVAREKAGPWCHLFHDDEWPAYEYNSDLGFYYGFGYGNELGPVQGVGWINELLARLTGQPVRDETQTNHTLDDSPITFPLDRTFYADFTHDVQMASIYGAMGLFKQSSDLNPLKPDPSRTWIASHMVLFSSRMVVEKLACEGEEDDYVRIVVNDEVQDLPFCGADGNGLCSVTNFVASQTFARENGEGKWPLCFETS